MRKTRVLVVGDSIAYGYSGTGYLGWVETLKTDLGAYEGLIYLISPAITGVTKRSYITMGAGWTTSAGYGIAGTAQASAPAGTAAALQVGPFICDGFIVYYLRRSGFGTFELQIDSEAAHTINANGSDALLGYQIDSASHGAHTLKIKNVVGGTCIPYAVEPILGDGAGEGIYLSNAGAPTSETSWWVSATSSVWAARTSVWAVPKPQLTIIATGGTNDMYYGSTPASYQANLEMMIGWSKLTGDALLVSGPARTGTYDYPFSDYRTAARAAAIAGNVTLIDLWSEWGGDISAQAGIFDSGDHVHPNDTGHASMAEIIYDEASVSSPFVPSIRYLHAAGHGQ